MDNSRREIKITNQIITVEKIKEIADYLQNHVDYYNELSNNDKVNYENKPVEERVYRYRAYSKHKIEYTTTFLDNRRIKTEEKNNFFDDLKEPNTIKELSIHSFVSYQSNITGEIKEYTISIYMTFWKDHVDIYSSSKNTDEEVNKINNDIREICEKGEERFSPIIKNRYMIKTVFAFAVGSVLSYIIVLLLYFLQTKDGSTFEFIFNSNILFLLVHWFIIFILGIFFGFPIINSLYKNVEPDKAVTFSNVELERKNMKDITERYLNGNEVLIWDKYNNMEKRNMIRKYYSFTKKILLVQVAISIIIFIIMTFTSNNMY